VDTSEAEIRDGATEQTPASMSGTGITGRLDLGLEPGRGRNQLTFTPLVIRVRNMVIFFDDFDFTN
jgi:hypothetical protein